MIGTAVQAINQHKNSPGHPLFGCEWKAEHSKLGNKHETDKHFCSGLFKIQTGKESNLSALEKAACQWLPKENNPAYKVDEDDASIDEVTPNAGMVVVEEEEALRHSALVTS